MSKETEKRKQAHIPKGLWFHMPREITLSSELNPYQYRMLAVLMDRENLFKSSWFWCATSWLVAHSGMKRTKAKETLNELEKMGFINITRSKDTRKANRYHINWGFIDSYQRPMTPEEQEEQEEQDAQSEISEEVSRTKPGKPSIEEWFQQKGKETLQSKFNSLAHADEEGDKKSYDSIKSAMLTSVCEEVSDNNLQDIWDYLLPQFKKYRRWFDYQTEKRRIKEKEYYGVFLSIEPSRRTFECGEYWKTNDNE